MRPALCLAACIVQASVLAPRAGAQWDSIPYTGGTVQYQRSYVLYESTAGIQVFSAMGQTWELLSPPGAVRRGQGETLVVTEEAGGVLRAWSALRSDSATLALPPGSSVTVSSDVALAWDDASGGNAVLHAYSPFLNAWKSLATAEAAAIIQPIPGGRVVAVNDGAGYHAYSARTGAWATLPLAANSNPQPFGDLAVADLGTGPGANPDQIAAFSGFRGTWAVSDPYPATISNNLVKSECVAGVRVKTADPARFAHSGFSAKHGLWVTSSVTHLNAASSGLGSEANVLFGTDPAASAAFEAFGAATGAWTGLAGAGLVFFNSNASCVMVRDPASGTVFAKSGLAGGGWVSAPIGTGATFYHTLESAALVQTASADWAFSAINNTWSASVPLPPSPSHGEGTAVFGFSGTNGTAPMAYSARWGQWVAHPTLATDLGDQTAAQGTVLYTKQVTASSITAIHAFDERVNRWAAPLVLGISPVYKSVGFGNVVLAYPTLSSSDPVYAYSGHRGAWSALPGVGEPISAITAYGDVATFRDASQNLWAFGALDRNHVMYDWPDGDAYQVSGSGPAGSAPQRLGLSVRGAPGAEVLFAYAALDLAPAPLAVPGVGGLLWLDPAHPILLGSLGVVDADGVADVMVPLPPSLPPGFSAWFQAVGVDLGTLEASFAGRAAQAFVF